MEMSGFWKLKYVAQPSLIGQVEKGIEPPSDLVSACNLLGEVKTFQDDCLQVVFTFHSYFSIICELQIIEGKSSGQREQFSRENDLPSIRPEEHRSLQSKVNVGEIGHKMLPNRWRLVHTASSHWVAQMTNLVRYTICTFGICRYFEF